MKKTILSLLVALMTTGAWAQSPTTSGIVWNTSTNSGTFLMPAYDVEVTTELWYRLSQTEDNTTYQTKTNIFLERTLQAGGWNTFCAPFAISNPATVFGEGVQVKAFSGSSLSGNTLTFPNTNNSLKAFRAYFQLSESVEARAFAMSFGDETGIESLTPNFSPKGEGSIYSLDGRKLNGQPTRKGVYIKNGKKTVIK